jgi:prophage regulatory protein
MSEIAHEFDKLASQLIGELRANDRLLTLPQVKERVPKSTATIYRWMAKGLFPKPHQIGPNTVMWRASDIDHFVQTGSPSPP